MTVLMHEMKQETPEIELSAAALKHIFAYLKANPEQSGVRLSVKKTGCSGLSYVVDFVQLPSETDMVKPLSDDYVLCIDRGSYPFLKNLQVDYVKQGLNYKFVFGNPNQTGQCGCGESFTV